MPIVADGYYEWKKTDDGKQPYLIERLGADGLPGGMLAMAGLWETNSKASSDNRFLTTCTILTTASNPLTSTIHDRMPVLLTEDDYDRWLDPAYHDTGALQTMLVPSSDESLTISAVSRHVNNSRHEDVACVDPA